MTKEEHEALLEEIARSGGDTAKMAESFDRLRADYDEREGMLRKYNETYDGENKDKWVSRDEYDKAIGERDKARKDYYDRFFSREKDEVMVDVVEDVKRDGTVQTFDTLFKRREG